MANFNFANLTTAVVGTISTISHAEQSQTSKDDSTFTTSNGTMTIAKSNNFGNINESEYLTVNHGDDKRPRVGIMYPRGGL